MNAPHARLFDLAEAAEPDPTDLEIVQAISDEFDIPLGAAIERLICVDFVAVRRQVTP